MKIATRIAGMTIWSLILLVGWLLYAQDKPSPPSAFVPSEVQLLRLQVRQRDMWLAQKDAIDAQRRWQQLVIEFNAEAEKVREENGWAKEVTFDRDSLKFSAPPAPPTSDTPKVVPDTPKQGPIAPTPARKP